MPHHHQPPHRSSRPALPLLRALLISLPCIAGLLGCASGNNQQHPDASSSSSPPTRAEPADVRAVALADSAEDHVRRGDTDGALREFEAAIEINPRLTRAHMGIGDIYRTQQDYAKAERAYGRAAAVEPRNFDAQFFHGLMLHLLERVTDAISAYLRALAIRPTDFQANLNLATAYYQLDENSQALSYARRAVSIRPEDGPARFNLGAIYAAVGRHADAVKEYQQAAELMDLTPGLLLNLADSLGQLDRYEEMRNTLEQLIKIVPTPDAYERLGVANFRLRRYEQAEEAFRNSLNLDPGYFPAMNGVAVCILNRYLWSGRANDSLRQEAAAHLRNSLKANPDQPKIVELLSRYGK